MHIFLDFSRWTRSVDPMVHFPHGRYIRAALESSEEEKSTTDPILNPLALHENGVVGGRGQLRPKRHKTPPRVHIHNIISGLPEPAIEVLYTVYQDEDPIPAELAVEALQEVEDSDVEGLLGKGGIF